MKLLATKNRLIVTTLLCGAFALTGCDKAKKILGREDDAQAPAAQASPAAQPAQAPSGTGGAAPGAQAPAAPAEPTPEPTATPVAINRNATVVILCYHRFEEPARDNLAITPREFEAQLQKLKDEGIEVIGMQDFLAWRRGEKNIPARSAVITIDDGYISGYTEAWPILKKFGYPFTMFVYVDYINSGGKAMTWDQLAEMRDAGVDIQSHTYTHQSLRGRSPGLNRQAAALIKEIGYEKWLEREVAESKSVLERNLAIRVNALAYPYGMYNQAARDAVKKAGYDAAFTVYGQRVGFSTPDYDLIGRYAIGSKETQIFGAAVRDSGVAGSEAVSTGPVVAQVAAASMVTQPMEGETVTDPRPIIRANLATMGEIDPDTIEMRISGYGLVSAVYDASSKLLSFQPPADKPLSDKHYTVIISAMAGDKKVETRWNFSFEAASN